MNNLSANVAENTDRNWTVSIGDVRRSLQRSVQVLKKAQSVDLISALRRVGKKIERIETKFHVSLKIKYRCQTEMHETCSYISPLSVERR